MIVALQLPEDPATTIDQLADVLKGDPALSGRILKFANSAFAGTRRPAVAVSEAAVRIGFRKVSQLALGFSLLSSYRSGPCRAFDYDGFWSECIATAASARALSHVIKATSGEEAFSFGLLCQIGHFGVGEVDAVAELLCQFVQCPFEAGFVHRILLLRVLKREGSRWGSLILLVYAWAAKPCKSL